MNLMRNEERYEADIGHEDSVVIEKKGDDLTKGGKIKYLNLFVSVHVTDKVLQRPLPLNRTLVVQLLI